MRFMMESNFLKPELSVEVSSLLTLWSIMNALREATQVGAEVRLEVVKAEE
jgi:hypothetical protein